MTAIEVDYEPLKSVDEVTVADSAVFVVEILLEVEVKVVADFEVVDFAVVVVLLLLVVVLILLVVVLLLLVVVLLLLEVTACT